MTPSPTAPRLGLCSVTFRHLPAADVARRAAEAGLELVEWGADVHAPPHEPDTVRAVRDATDRHGLVCCSYGSYFRAAPGELAGFPALARTAVLLGAPRMRVWAGDAGSGEASPAERRGVVAGLREASRIAADHGLELGLEFHAKTLTDTVASTLRLLDEVGAPQLRTYWQPPQDAPDDTALAGLSALGDRVCAVHVFSWWPGNHRLPLAAREDLWAGVFDVLREQRLRPDALLEFVPGADPAVLAREAGTLRDAVTRRPRRAR
ncbi:sugar phosphate isomerase/epimerase [Streptomyces sp. NBC_00234]|uniref:sugar phosphate isomerase/epimerase family protein n=1 Tax=Streptomyces sp. NBC_00234 TaxID=2903638 RepID=UPI002E2AF04B|nr:TIM barrel protein [Streptomyces sp. NBC_00234]